MKEEENRGKGGRVVRAYELSPTADGSMLEHYMTVLEPRKGAASLKTMYSDPGRPAALPEQPCLRYSAAKRLRYSSGQEGRTTTLPSAWPSPT